jgi:hypothetical protein
MPVDLAQAQHIRLRSGSENSSSKLAAFWAGAALPISGIGAVLLAELTAAAATVGGYVPIVAGYLTLAGVVVVAGAVITGDTRSRISIDKCIDYFAYRCISGPCGDCLHYCRAQGRIDTRCRYK